MSKDVKEKKVLVQDKCPDVSSKMDALAANLTPEERQTLLGKLAAKEGVTLRKANAARDEFVAGLSLSSDRIAHFCEKVTALISGPFAVTVGRDVDGWLFCDSKRLRRREKGKEQPAVEQPTAAPAEQPAAQATA